MCNSTVGFRPPELQQRVSDGDRKALAYSWILGYLANLNDEIDSSGWRDERSLSEISFKELMDTAKSHVKKSAGGKMPEEGPGNLKNGSWYFTEYIVRAGVFEGCGTDPKFWEHFATLMEVDI